MKRPIHLPSLAATLSIVRVCMLLLWSHVAAHGFEHPGGLYTRKQIEHVKAQVASGKQPWLDGYGKLIKEAESLKQRIPSPPASLVVPPYYEHPSGNASSSAGLKNDAKTAYALALAFTLDAPAKNAYAAKAVEILNAWAKENHTLSFEHDTPLMVASAGIGFIYAAELLYHYDGWQAKDKEAFMHWVRDVFLPSQQSIRDTKKNNWACWGLLSSTAAGHLLEDSAEMDVNLKVLRSQISTMIAEDGSMPEETRRGERGMWYTAYSLAPMTQAAEYLRNYYKKDVHLYVSPEGRSIRQAVDYLHRYVRNPSLWPHHQPQLLLPLPGQTPGNMFEALHAIYGISDYGDWVASSRPVMQVAHHHLAWKYATLMKPYRPGKAEQTFLPVEDATVRNGEFADDNYGDSESLTVKGDSPGYSRRFFLKFDIGSFQGIGAQRAVIRIRSIDSGTDPFRTLQVWSIPDSGWNENTITWNNSPALGGRLSFNPNIQNLSGIWYDFDVTDYVNACLANGISTVSFALVHHSAHSSQSQVSFHSRESEEAQPLLEIQSSDPAPSLSFTQVLPCVADATVRGGEWAGDTHGELTELVVKNDVAAEYTRKAFLKFDISSLHGTVVPHAKIRICACTAGTEPSRTIKAYAVPDSDWIESTITWDNAPSLGSHLSSSPGMPSTPGVWYDFDVTDQIHACLANGVPVVSFALVNDGLPDSQSTVSFHSRESDQGQPYLEIESSVPSRNFSALRFDWRKTAAPLDLEISEDLTSWQFSHEGILETENGFQTYIGTSEAPRKFFRLRPTP